MTMNKESVKFLSKVNALFGDKSLKKFIHDRSFPDLILLLCTVTDKPYSFILSQVHQLLQKANHCVTDRAALLLIPEYLKIFQAIAHREKLIPNPDPEEQDFSLSHH
ncbi:MAG: hypothetical protein ACFFBD_25310 [Candidatus Hodarchaeota archaeon]